MEKWVLVADTDICQFSKKQIEVIKENNINIKGAVLCNEKQNDSTPICHKVDFFPSFCNVEKNICVPGFIKNKKDFENLEDVLRQELEKNKI